MTDIAYGALARAEALAAGDPDWMNCTRWPRAELSSSPAQVIEGVLRDAHADWFSPPAEAAEGVLAALADAGFWVVPLVGLTERTPDV